MIRHIDLFIISILGTSLISSPPSFIGAFFVVGWRRADEALCALFTQASSKCKAAMLVFFTAYFLHPLMRKDLRLPLVLWLPISYGPHALRCLVEMEHCLLVPLPSFAGSFMVFFSKSVSVM